MNNKELYGVSDLPLEANDSNCLGTEDYVKGLVQFINGCQTPMSVALQGDWGTGKSTFINQMIASFSKENKEVIPVYFNTWQYSQFNMSGDLYTSFIINIIESISKVNKMNSEKGKKILTTLSKIAVNGVGQFITAKTGFDTSLAMEMFTHEKTNSVSQLKEDFSNLVNEVADNGRVVIFVDDLDRLSPETAVELLEIMKLFMDVKKCVFVLAIDYGVVVKGVRAKYGKDMTDEKCRSFFDKIIQLPFRMPVENYTIDKLVKETFKGDINDEILDVVTGLLKDTLGMNPRTFKRLYNSFTLLRLVHDVNKKNDGGKLDEKGKFLLLASLVLQISSIMASELLVNHKDDVEEMQSLLENPSDFLARENSNINGETERKLTSEEQSAVYILKKLNSSLEQANNIFRDKNIYKSFCDVLSLTAITSIPKAEEPKERKKAIQINKVIIRGIDENISVQTATEAAKITIELILKNNPSRVEELLNKYSNLLTINSDVITEGKNYFRASSALDYTYNGATIYLGTSMSTLSKFERINNICRFLNLEPNAVQWLYDEEVIFSNDNK